MSNGLDPDQDPLPVDPDLDSNCFQRLSADINVTARKERVNHSTSLNAEWRNAVP